MEDVVGATEAMRMTGYTRSNIARLCRKGKFPGARKVGHKWIIPRTSVENYQPGPQGFAAHPENAGKKKGKKQKKED